MTKINGCIFFKTYRYEEPLANRKINAALCTGNCFRSELPSLGWSAKESWDVSGVYIFYLFFFYYFFIFYFIFHFC